MDNHLFPIYMYLGFCAFITLFSAFCICVILHCVNNPDEVVNEEYCLNSQTDCVLKTMDIERAIERKLSVVNEHSENSETLILIPPRTANKSK